jgi:hypothetical protein
MNRANSHRPFKSHFQTTQTVQDKLLVTDDCELEGMEDSQDPYGGQDPYIETMNILAAIGDGGLYRNNSADVGPKEDGGVGNAHYSRANDMFHSTRLKHALAVTTP